MKSYILEKVGKLPLPVNNLLMGLNAFPRLIYGNKYSSLFHLGRKEGEYNNDSDLISMVNYCIENVPFYRNYRKISTRQEFEEQFTFIDKDTVSNNFEQFISISSDLSNYEIVTTGGTSGNPLKLYVPKDRYIVELSTMHRMWSRVGFNHHVRGVIRNKRLAPDVDYIINPITKEVIFDGFRLNSEYYRVIYNVLKKMGIAFIHAYPSNAYEFSRFLYDNKLDVSFINSFLSGSENIYSYQKEFIRDKLGIDFYNWYGHSEKLVLGGYCEHSDVYHIEPRYGYFELINQDGKPIETVGETGEIVGTTLNNWGMPLIRYKTDDYAEYVGDFCTSCGRRLPLIKNIKGRWSGSVIYGADGTTTTTTALNFHDDLYLYISGIQYVQREKGKLEILVMKGMGFKDEHDRRLYQYYKSKFSENTIIEIKYVNQLIKKPNGKFVELISEVDDENNH